ncbi:igLON family member 5-like [Physella acuta]|uniref:igLON family member 5-like n=1 Tax=Physella acuta TaxID=109671 RepID=UPI0027DB9236|nr:igLON family member 5-like [Physella acuta]
MGMGVEFVECEEWMDVDCLYKKPKEIKPFDDTPMTITVVSGTTALLPCEVDPNITEMNPDMYRVVWVNPLETVVSMQERRLLNDMRISVERLRTRDWNLHIRNVSVTDAGVYKCQLNVNPVGNKHITLVVHEPPRIVEHTSPAIVKKREGDTVEIYCNATGTPQPTVRWFRVNKRDDSRDRVGNTGESLVIHNISRSCADFYECIADNGVQPSMSQKFEVIVNYKPEVVLGNTRLNQALGKDTVLDCEVYASPVAAAWWQHKDR